MVKPDPKTNQNNIKICPRCKGNGYFTVKESVELPVDKVVPVSYTHLTLPTKRIV